jgi:methionine sulfoxide reductase heme-binding subunit
MSMKMPALWTGWRLTGLIGTAVLSASALAVWASFDSIEGVRLAIRLTARTSLVLFLLAFTASALSHLYPMPLTRWLRANRRYIGVSFAVSHLVHAIAIIALARLDYDLFRQITNIGAYIGGGLAYVFIVLMTLTSFDRTAALIGRHTWFWLHTIGMWYIWLSFALNFGKRVPGNSLYLLPVSLIVLAMAIRLWARWRKSARRPGWPERFDPPSEFAIRPAP